MEKSSSHTKSKNERKTVRKILKILKSKGTNSLQIAREAILKENVQSIEAREALHYYANDFLEPTPSALLALTCEATGQNAKRTFLMGAALTLFVGAVDIHDDIIDQSIKKFDRLTVFGKFGKEIALLTGNAFLFEGFTLFHKATDSFDVEKTNYLAEILKAAFFEMGDAHALEVSLRGTLEISPKEFLRIIEMKAACWEAITKVGAIMGDATEEEVKALARYGRIWGILSTIRNDFIDLFEIDELRNRVSNEILPLPILYVFDDPMLKKKIITMLSKKNVARSELDLTLNMILEAKQTNSLRKLMQELIYEAKSCLATLKQSEARTTLEMFVSAMIEDLK
jgi:geranylgeranyl pyrophosphate synthase